MRICTSFAMAKARQFEAELKSIQKEWNRNQIMPNMMHTSSRQDELMYPSRWDENKEWTLPSRSIDWPQVSNEDHDWDVQQMHEYVMHMAGHKLWPYAYAMILHGFGCAI